MKEKYVERINKSGKYAGAVINVLKVLAAIGIVAVIVLYLFLDSIGKYVCSVRLSKNLDIEMDLRNFGFVYSEVDKAEQLEYEELEWGEYARAEGIFGVTKHNGLKVKLLDAYSSEYTDVSNNTKVTRIYMRNLDTFLIMVLIYMVMIFVTLVFMGRFFKALQKEHSPFGKYVIKNMQKIALSLVPWGVICPVTDFESLKSVSKFSVLAGVNIVTIFVIIMLLCLVYIFKYGALLQQESDETL